MNCVLEQGIWFEGIKIDDDDYPDCVPLYKDRVTWEMPLYEEYNLFDYSYGINRYIALSELLKSREPKKWREMLELAKKCDSITIVDDVPINNFELDFIRDFYIKTFYSQLKRQCKNCSIYIAKSQAVERTQN